MGKFLGRITLWFEYAKKNPGQAIGLLIVGILPIAVLGLAERQVTVWEDEFLAKHGTHWAAGAVVVLVDFCASHPIWAILAFALAVVLGLIAHAYVVTHPFRDFVKNQGSENKVTVPSTTENFIKIPKLSDRARALTRDLDVFINEHPNPEVERLTDMDEISRLTGPAVEAIHFGYAAHYKARVEGMFAELAAEGIYEVFEEWEISPQVQTADKIKINIVDRLKRLADRYDAKHVVPGTLSLDEHDPKVYLEPVNPEFDPPGSIPFDIANLGQRVNVAHKIVIHPIAVAPAICFEYIDHLDMAQHQKIRPKILNKNPFHADNVLGVLGEALAIIYLTHPRI